MKKKTGAQLKVILCSVLTLLGIIFISVPVSAEPSCVIYNPLSTDDPYFVYRDTVYYDAVVTGLRTTFPHFEYVQYSKDSGTTWSNPIYPYQGQVTIDDEEEAENLPIGNITFIIRVRCNFDDDEWTFEEHYEVAAWEVTIDSPAQNQFLDFDDVDHNVTLKVWKSDNITMYIENPSTSQWEECRYLNTSYEDATQHTVDYFWIEYKDLTDAALANVDYEDVCYTSFEVKFTNRYKNPATGENFIDSDILNFKVLWNSVELDISFKHLYTGTIGAEGTGELYFELERMIPGQYNTSEIVHLEDYTNYDYTDGEYWEEDEYSHSYGNSKDDSSSGWWRKDSLGNVISTNNQRRCIKLYDKDPPNGPSGDDLMHIFYFYFDPYSNHQNKEEVIGALGELAEDGNDGSIYWQVSRPDNEWGDYWFSVDFVSIQLNPQRYEH